jgi:hypothetical protein
MTVLGFIGWQTCGRHPARRQSWPGAWEPVSRGMAAVRLRDLTNSNHRGKPAYPAYAPPSPDDSGAALASEASSPTCL